MRSEFSFTRQCCELRTNEGMLNFSRSTKYRAEGCGKNSAFATEGKENADCCV